jgi:hypothetical protein
MATATADPRQEQADQPQQPPQQQEQAARKRTTLLDAVVDATPEFHREVERYEYDLSMAKMFAQSGLFNELKGVDPPQAVAAAMTKIALGRTMGFNPAESMQGIDVVTGRLSIGAHLRAARMKRYGYSWKFLQFDSKGCSMRLYYKDQPLTNEDGSAAIVSFGEAEANAAKLIKKDGAYEKNPKNMYFCRTVSNAQRWYAPEALGAGTELPSTEELCEVNLVEFEPTSTTIRPPQRASAATADSEAVA